MHIFVENPDLLIVMNRLVKASGLRMETALQLRTAGIRTLEGMVASGSTPDGRQRLVQQTGLNEAHIEQLTHLADLLRLKGVGVEYARLLLASGVQGVASLAGREARLLYLKMRLVNLEKQLVRQLPGIAQVQDFVNQARRLCLAPYLTLN